jgi:Zn-finger nucleic acid-binding protein
MIVLEIDAIEIDYCTFCNGVWLDAGELELFLDEASNKDQLMTSLAKQVGGKEKRIRCPICSDKLDKVLYGVERKVLLDKCERNDGLWFDQGELQDVLQMGDFLGESRVYSLLNEVFGKGGSR